MDRNFYRFRSEWFLDVPPAITYEALEHFEDYPRWWPEVRSLRLIDPEACEVTCRSVVPYTLTFVLRPTRRDPEVLVLEASTTGDLEGFCRWTVAPHPSGSTLIFEEEVRANKRLLRLLAPVARPVFRGNHSIMMKHGNAGLVKYLATFRPVRQPADWLMAAEVLIDPSA